MSSGSPSRLNTLWKGKAIATEEDFDDLHPVITYRHLAAQNLGVKDPFRVVALCDSDAFYAACEMVRLGIDKNRPLVVLQWEALIAVNYPARKFGISRMDKLKDAKRRCPELVVVHVATYKEGEKEPGYWDNVDSRTHKVSLDHYRRESMKILGMFKHGLPGCEIEKASIDEAFIDFTRPVREMLVERYPYLAHVPSDAPNGLDSPLPPPPPISWDGLGIVIPTTNTAPESADGEDIYHEDDESTSWHDVALSIAAELMGKIRDKVHTKLGYTTSAGIARNKFLAKLSASYKKPNSQSILRNAAIPIYLKPMAFQKIRFLGGKLGDALQKEYDVSTVEDLLSVSLDEMQRKFGDNAIWVYEVLRGIDRTEVKAKSAMTKSMLASKNLPQPITRASEGQHWIRVLAAELALRLNNARESEPTLWPKTIVLHARQGYETGRSKQASFPFTREVTVDTIAAAGDRLWKELVPNNTTPMKVTNVQLAFTGLETAESGQRNIEGFFTAGSPAKRPREHGHNDDRYSQLGSIDIVGYGLPVDHTAAVLQGVQSDPSDGDTTSFTCVRCGRQFFLPKPLPDVEDANLKAEGLAAMRMEHDDFHYAYDLAKESDNAEASRGMVRDSTVKKMGQKQKQKRLDEPKGIEKFFNRK